MSSNFVLKIVPFMK